MRLFSFSLLFTLLVAATPTFAHEEHVTTQYYEVGPWGNLIVRIHTASHALGDIADRIDTRATIIAQAGIDSADARAPLAEARHMLATADKQLGDAVTRTLDIQEMQVSLRQTVALIQEAKASLRESVATLKDATAEHTLEATELIDVSMPEVQ